MVTDGQVSQSKRNALWDHFITSNQTQKKWKMLVDDTWKNHPEGSSQLIVSERKPNRPTHRLDRGDFLSPRELIKPGFPKFLHDHETASGKSLNRRDLALWLVDKKSPTTARTIVNRTWQTYFGSGLTATPDDLGLQGEPPTHPELLDWLAVDLMENQWSLKSLHRKIVHSQTYRQSSNVSAKLLELDPANRLLARSSRIRVPAEMVRDIALSASGLLNPEIGGRPVFPPAPEFLFKPPASYGPKTWDYESDQQKYRRAFYTFRFRSVPYPAFQAFDAPTGEVSCVRRNLSNTPMQALVTLNEPLFVECAQNLAKLVMSAGLDDDEHRIEFLFSRCISRPPTTDEFKIVSALLTQQRHRMANEKSMAYQLTGSEQNINQYEVNELAAWTAVCRVVLNLDETITKS